ncbi:hypothetical protein AMAG_04718 [Allomyces macrogynus ATCC 38327]|uniref:SH3 domain-containing protein n=1 Tax=Allomyces macrogynus (strain ATCC 38327) TaxID=578462 RepID=A0A0L0S5Q5_ALLM3|nr:hypothetical protein AMAG_04718 [Allomyces macrogynus ATCC 38327]|eukprot:KNE57873.1 hypothetical protein AMAG_04718 [Allomyces macrogynus ATCC 38327]
MPCSAATVCAPVPPRRHARHGRGTAPTAATSPRRTASLSPSLLGRPAVAGLLLMLLLATASMPSAQAANLASGRGGCQGIDVSQSKYCSAFGTQLLAPTNLTSTLYTVMVRSNKSDDDVRLIQSFKVDNLQSVTDFDTLVMENVILANLPDINHRWFRCPFKNRGVRWDLSWYCNLLLNPETGACPMASAPDVPGLCKATADEAFSSARANQPNDQSCDGSQNGSSTFINDLNRVYASIVSYPRMYSSGDKCISGSVNEGPLKLCGYPTLSSACLAGCATASGCTGVPAVSNPSPSATPAGDANGLNQGSTSSTSLGVILGSVLGAVVLGGILLGLFLYRRRSQRQMVAAQGFSPAVASTTSHLQYVDAPKATAMANLAATGMVARSADGSAVFIPNAAAGTPPLPGGASPPMANALPQSPLLPGDSATAPRAGMPIPPPPMTERMSTLTPPPRMSFYGDDDRETIAPEDSASNVGINPRYRSDRPPARPTSVLRPSPLGNGGGGGDSGSAATPPVPPVPENADALAAAAAAATAILGSLPAAGLVTFASGVRGRRVYHAYIPRRDDELAITAGDVVRVDLVFSDGWASGMLLDAAGTAVGNVGVFPVAALDPVLPTPTTATPTPEGGIAPGSQQ